MLYNFKKRMFVDKHSFNEIQYYFTAEVFGKAFLASLISLTTFPSLSTITVLPSLFTTLYPSFASRPCSLR